MPYDLNDIGQCAALARQIKADIDEFSKKAFDDGFRSHLGASIIGHDCARYVWYTFRWMFTGDFEPRMLRLFNRGHREEAAFLHLLRGCGWDVSDTTEDGKQHRISGAEGHFGGSLDSRATPPARYQILQSVLLAEFKTKGTGRGFQDMLDKGVMTANPQHFAQMCVYGEKQDLDFAIYMVVNKNDDTLHVDIVKLDRLYGRELIAKGTDIILQKVPPRRIAATAAFHKCKICDAKGICWEGAPLARNCRSCVYAQPIEGAAWRCNGYNQVIPKDFLPKGCDRWTAIER